MKANPLVIAAAVLALLGGAVYYTTENPPPPDQEEKPALVEAELDDIQEVTIVRPSGDSVTVVRGDDDKWDFGGDIDLRADDASIGLMATNLAGLSADRLVAENIEDWRPYGLEDKGNLAVTMTPKEGDPVQIIFGNDTPTGSGVFARLGGGSAGDPRLFTVYNYVKTSFEKEIFDWRDKKLLRVETDKVSRVRVQVGAKEFELGKSDAAAWQILQPAPLRADDFTAGDLARAIQNAEMTAVLSEGEDTAAKYSFRRPYAVAEIVDEAGAHTLTIAKADDDSYYANSTDQPGVYAVSSTLAESLDKDLDELRNKKLFDFGFDPLASLQVRDGETKAAIEKRDDKWVLTSADDRELDSEKVQTLIDSLRNLTATAFPSDRAADQARYGLDAPVIEATVTPEGEPAETIVLSSLGQTRVYAARQGEATTYEIEKAPAEEIRRALEGLLAEPEPEPEESDSAAESQ